MLLIFNYLFAELNNNINKRKHNKCSYYLKDNMSNSNLYGAVNIKRAYPLHILREYKRNRGEYKHTDKVEYEINYSRTLGICLRTDSREEKRHCRTDINTDNEVNRKIHRHKLGARCGKSLQNTYRCA